MGLLKGPDIVGGRAPPSSSFFFFVVNQSLGHHLESEKEQNAPNLSLKLFTAPHSARCVMGKGGGGGGLLCRYSTFPASSPSLRLSPLCRQLSCHISELFHRSFIFIFIFFFWGPSYYFHFTPNLFFLPSQQKRDETLSTRLHLLLLKRQKSLRNEASCEVFEAPF